MKKTIAIFTLIFALLLTTGCAASNAAQEPMEAMHLEIQPAANPIEEVVDEQTEAPTEAPTEKPASDEPTPIGKEKALQIALDHAEVDPEKAAFTKIEYDAEDGEYDVEFRYNNYEYDYAIHVTTGKVLKHEKEYDGPAEAKTKETKKAATKATEKAAKATEKATEKAAEKTLIGKNKAKSIALKHAGFSADEVSGLQVEYDKDDGVPVYEVEFHKGHKEYSYEIHGESGKILSWEIDD